MRRLYRIACCLLLCPALCIAVWAQGAESQCPAIGTTYGVSLRRAAEHTVHVDVVAHAPTGDFQLPVWNALYQVRDFAQYASHASAGGGVPAWMCAQCALGDASVRKVDKTTWRVETGSQPCITFSYDIYANDAGPFGAQLDSDHAFFNWAEVLVYRTGHRDEPVTVRLLDVPPGWRLRDTGPFGGLDERQTQSADGHAEKYDRLVDSPIEMGTFAESSYQQDGATYHVVVDGDSADYDMVALKASLQKITAAAVDWMQDRPYGEYTFIYHFPQGPAGGGMEHAYGTAIDLSAGRLQRDPLAVAGVSAHEFFHLWNVKRIRPRSLEPVDYTQEQYTRVLWFSEGVDSTVAEHILVRAGLIDGHQFLARLAQQIGQLYSRPARKWQSVEESSLDTWFDKYPHYQDAERSISYYNKGQIVGVMLDLEMRRASGGRKSLRDLFQYMNQRWAKRGEFFDDSESIRQAAEVLTGGDFRDFFRHYVSGTDEIPYDDFFATVGLHLVHRQEALATPGFITGRVRNGVAAVIRVESDREAEEQGIAPGDEVLEFDGKPLPADFATTVSRRQEGESVRFKIRHEGREREVTLRLYLRQVDEYALEDLRAVTPAQAARRTAWIHGESQPEAGK